MLALPPSSSVPQQEQSKDISVENIKMVVKLKITPAYKRHAMCHSNALLKQILSSPVFLSYYNLNQKGFAKWQCEHVLVQLLRFYICRMLSFQFQQCSFQHLSLKLKRVFVQDLVCQNISTASFEQKLCVTFDLQHSIEPESC